MFREEFFRVFHSPEGEGGTGGEEGNLFKGLKPAMKMRAPRGLRLR